MDKKNIKRLIIKYAWLLAVYYFIVILIPDFLSSSFVQWMDIGANPITFSKIQLSIQIIGWMIYLIVLGLMFQDYRKYDIKPIWIILITLLNLPIGVCIFFINILFEKE